MVGRPLSISIHLCYSIWIHILDIGSGECWGIWSKSHYLLQLISISFLSQLLHFSLLSTLAIWLLCFSLCVLLLWNQFIDFWNFSNNFSILICVSFSVIPLQNIWFRTETNKHFANINIIEKKNKTNSNFRNQWSWNENELLADDDRAPRSTGLYCNWPQSLWIVDC